MLSVVNKINENDESVDQLLGPKWVNVLTVRSAPDGREASDPPFAYRSRGTSR